VLPGWGESGKLARTANAEVTMRRGALWAVVLAAGLAGCEEKQKSMENLAHDQEIVKAASVAANEVVRNAPDCATARPLIPEALRRIEEARGQVKATASLQLLDTLKAQVDRVAQLCPG
jgi:hypothetical protein